MADESQLPAPPAGPAPVRFEVDAPLGLARWRPLVQWVLAIPHFVVAYALGYVGQVVAFISWFAILFTGKLPEGLANFQMMALRYSPRTQAYAGYLYADYPPFEFATTAADPRQSPVIIDFRPELVNRNRLTVFFRLLLAIPLFFIALFVGLAAFFAWIAAFFAILFTGAWPAGLREFAVRVTRWGLQINTYVTLLTDRYPPWMPE